jgi:hypothetical protein
MSELILDGDIVVKDCDRQLVDDILRRQRGTSTSRHSSPDACRHLIRRRAASQRHARHPPIESRPASDGRRTIVGSVSHLQGALVGAGLEALGAAGFKIGRPPSHPAAFVRCLNVEAGPSVMVTRAIAKSTDGTV